MHLVIYMGYLQKRRTTTDEYYVNFSNQLNDDLKKKQPLLSQQKMLRHQKNSRVQRCVVPMKKFYEFCLQLYLSNKSLFPWPPLFQIMREMFDEVFGSQEEPFLSKTPCFIQNVNIPLKWYQIFNSGMGP